MVWFAAQDSESQSIHRTLMQKRSTFYQARYLTHRCDLRTTTTPCQQARIENIALTRPVYFYCVSDSGGFLNDKPPAPAFRTK